MSGKFKIDYSNYLIVPLPLKKLKMLSTTMPIVEEVDIISRRKKSTSAKWVAMINGRAITAICDSYEHAVYTARLVTNDTFNVAKLHVVGDSELIKKINKTNV